MQRLLKGYYFSKKIYAYIALLDLVKLIKWSEYLFLKEAGLGGSRLQEAGPARLQEEEAKEAGPAKPLLINQLNDFDLRAMMMMMCRD